MEQVKFRFTLASVYGKFPVWMKAHYNAKLITHVRSCFLREFWPQQRKRHFSAPRMDEHAF